MPRIEKTVFISYRHTNAAWARAIFQDLNQHGYDAFLDYTGLASGDFESVILENINSRAHFIVLLTPSALEQCGEPGDWLRREIEAALDSRRNIVPLMFEGFDFGTPTIANQLTGKLAALKQYNAMSVPPEYFDAAMAKLRDKFLNVPLDAVLHPASSVAHQAATRQKGAAAKAPRVEEDELTALHWFERGFNAEDPAEKVRLFSEAIRLKPDFAEAFSDRSVARADLGDLEGSFGDANEAIRLKPDLEPAFVNRGRALGQLGDLEGAISDYDEAIRLKPDFAEAFTNRGLARAQSGDLDGALQDHDRAINLKPDLAIAFNNRGNARADLGDLEGALSDFEQCLKLNPTYSFAYNNRGSVRKKMGDLEGALADFDDAIRLRADNAGFYQNRGLTRSDTGDNEGAIEDYGTAIELDPNFAAAYMSRGIAHAREGDVESAIEDLNEAVRLQPDSASIVFNRAVAYETAGDLESALRDYNEALRLKPDFEAARKSRDELRKSSTKRSKSKS